MHIFKTFPLLLVLAVSVSWASETTSSGESPLVVTKTATCSAAVFEKFCLGETSQSLLERHKPKSSRERDGETLLLYREEGGAVFVTIKNNTVVFIRKLISKASWGAYDKIVGAFESKYGPGHDGSQFPDYAKDQKDKESALRAGSGYRKHSWKGDKWAVELTWRKVGGSDREISLAYNYQE
jgi:hypothetical protein